MLMRCGNVLFKYSFWEKQTGKWEVMNRLIFGKIELAHVSLHSTVEGLLGVGFTFQAHPLTPPFLLLFRDILFLLTDATKSPNSN